MSATAGGFSMPPPPPPPQQQQQQGFAMPTSTVELSVSCANLSDRDVLSKSDPICVMFKNAFAEVAPAGKRTKGWVEFGRTEMIKDTLNPKWQHKFVVDYSFEERQEVKFEIYDSDSTSTKLNVHDFLGQVQTTLGSIVSAKGKQFVSPLQKGDTGSGKGGGGGLLHIAAEELACNRETAKINFIASGLDKKDGFFGKSDPFFELSKETTGGGSITWSVVYRSETITNTLNPDWLCMEKSVRDICNGNYDRKLKLDVYDMDNDGSHDYIGGCITTLKELSVAAADPKSFPLINPKKQKKKGAKYKNSGVIKLKSLRIETSPSFLDYIQGGTVMNFSVAVDFTASNGNPNDPKSLHFRGNGGENQYTTAIRAIGNIIQDYDSDRQFPALGFGARIPPSGQVSHEFFLNLQDNPYCLGVEGLLKAYHTALTNVQLYGPTNFTPVINHVASIARGFQDGRQYFVLLILTDGIITDMDETQRAIVSASDLPMSVIIVGVGREDFSAMEALDSDGGMLRAGGRVAARDIVQFVEMRKFVEMSHGMNWDKESLAKEVLAEIPKQFLNWMKSRGVKPIHS